MQDSNDTKIPNGGVFDIKPPAKQVPDSTSRPLVGQTDSVEDPMVNPSTSIPVSSESDVSSPTSDSPETQPLDSLPVEPNPDSAPTADLSGPAPDPVPSASPEEIHVDGPSTPSTSTPSDPQPPLASTDAPPAIDESPLAQTPVVSHHAGKSQKKIVIILAVVLLIAIAAFVYLLIKRHK